MSDVIESTLVESGEPVKRGRGRPRKERPTLKREVTRGTRVPLGGFEGPLALVKDKLDPNFHYFWAKDTNHDGAEIERFMQAGYEFVTPKEGVVRGRSSVYATPDLGELIRRPAGQGEFHFLMKVPMEFYEDDLAFNSARTDAQEAAMTSSANKNGDFYGGLTTLNR